MKRFFFILASSLIFFSCQTKPETNGGDQAPEEVDQALDLSANGTSNCYIITEPGEYKFRADVRGNGVSVPDVVFSEPLSGDTLSLVWQSRVDMINSLELRDGYVRFVAGAETGNALIALLDGEEIVWSWHIWHPAQAPSELVASNGYTVMDRNLGAINSTKEDICGTYGLLYQWGRKDPFPGAPTVTGDVNTMPSEVYDAEGNKVEISHSDYSSSEFNTIENAISNPTVVFSNYALISSGKDWLSSSNDALWGCANSNESGGKSCFDPCPLGWRVPPADAFKYATSSGGYEVDASGFCVEGDFDYGWNLILDKASGLTSFFPAAARYDGTYAMLYGSVAGLWGSYWSNAPYDSNLGYCLLSFRKESMSPAAGAARADAYSVRCVKE